MPAHEIIVDGAAMPRFTGAYAFFAEPPVDRPISLQYPLREEELVLKHRTREIRVRLRGDAIAAMENFGADLTFFDPL